MFSRAFAVLSGFLSVMPVHDIYTDLKSPNGSPCCAQNDCEWVDYRVHPNGDVDIESRRFGAVVRVHRDMILWSHIEGSTHTAHWCGGRRSELLGTLVPQIVADNPDPAFVTFCAFIDPGGT
jgi:hypothetical protein